MQTEIPCLWVNLIDIFHKAW